MLAHITSIVSAAPQAFPTFGLDFFGAIPFAEPPLGELRLKPPVLKTQLDVETFDASSFGKGCFQLGGTATTFTEDCLTINVFRPSGISSNAKLPVVRVTLFSSATSYGGGFQDGEASIFNASALVAQSIVRGTPIVYVNFNYRLGPLGFPQGQEAENRGALNLGLKDQLTALDWVQANIANLAGTNPSAGAIMTAVLFLNSPIEKLARAAIFESGSAATAPIFPAAQRENDWQLFVEGVPSCANLTSTANTFSCLRKANSTEIFSGVANAVANSPDAFPFSPTIDGPGGLIPDLPSHLFARGQFARLPFIAGTNLDEGTTFVPMASLTTAELQEALIENYSPSLPGPGVLSATTNKLLELYPDVPALGSPFNTGNETFGLTNYKRAAAILGDTAFQAQRRSWSRTATKAGVKTFGYLFTQPQPGSNPALGVFHSAEVFFVYGAPPDTSVSALQLSSIMIDYWVSFATSLDPNDGHGNPRPNWAQYTAKNEVLLQLNAANLTLIPDNYRKEQIDFIMSDPTVFHARRSLHTAN
ncbi:esterase 1 [Gymnopilus junonius]|uniref:Esterase 1 n=1 Tax=Gymnopilus junonius TaxID=109634 RepID=A0A9P5NZ26_GYMJU|nr:esterase 1 [Gymnopilus junonius]